MTRELTAFEVVKIAEQMERSAARFYRKAAGLYDDPSLAKLFSELAQWEKRHIQVFADMKNQFAAQTWEGGSSGPERVDVSRLEVPPAAFNEHSEPAKELTGKETRVEVLNLALKKERYTIGCYTSLTEFALGPENTQAIKGILQEEKKHIRILMQSLRQTAG
jgi:rubrerythrin